MSLPAWKTFGLAGALALTVSAASAAAIDCSKIGTAYDNLFADGSKRVETLVTQFKALPTTATEQQRDALRKQYCAVAGEVVGFYKIVRAMATDCSSQGADMKSLLDVINQQLGLAQQGVQQVCG